MRLVLLLALLLPVSALPQDLGALFPEEGECFLDPESALFDQEKYESALCRTQRQEHRLMRLQEESRWNHPARHVLARLQPTIDRFLKDRGYSKADIKAREIGEDYVRLRLRQEVCLFSMAQVRCVPANQFRK